MKLNIGSRWQAIRAEGAIMGTLLTLGMRSDGGANMASANGMLMLHQIVPGKQQQSGYK